jgi:hypothetical protein
MSDDAYDYVWHSRKNLPGRKGQRCRVLARGRMNSVLVEFEDGFRAIVSRFALRRSQDRPLEARG